MWRCALRAGGSRLGHNCRPSLLARAFSSGTRFDAIQQQLDEMRGVAGTFGGDHAVYHAVAEAQTGRTLHRLSEGHSGMTDEYKVPALVSHLQNPETQKVWEKISSLNPLGMDSLRPSISATPANMEVPEIMAKLRRDGDIVNPDGSIRVVKVAIDPVWDIPRLAEAVGAPEAELRARLVDWTQNPSLADPANNIFLPAIGGTTVYIIGDPSAIHDPSREVACRPHDECNGSDVFGTDICTCRPYLAYAIQDSVETAQRGGVGIIAYYRKEGRALGEVTKFRVYNSRKYQVGGDRADTYFEQTANIAGIEDARVQQLMPDALRFLGIKKIDRLLSMSKDKYEALLGADIEIAKRVSLPESWVPAGATVEITAKIAAGYNGFQPEVGTEASDKGQLWTLDAVRERSHRLLEIGLQDQLPNFAIDMSKLDDTADKVLDSVRTRYPTMDIPIHSRMRHFESGGVDRVRDLEMIWARNNVDSMEAARRKIDLIVISVLLDAGAGAAWRYDDASGSSYSRSEGLAVASYDMFSNGVFSSQGNENPHVVDADAILALDLATLSNGFKITTDNQMAGLEGRLDVLHRLGVAMQTNHQIFLRNGSFRPGNILDHVLRETLAANPVDENRLSMRVLWKGVVEGLGEVFPDPSGQGLGDCWHHSALGEKGSPEAMVPFHKLTQWLTYSLIEPFGEFGIHFVDNYLLTGLAEYRNGGLFIDSGVLVPRDPSVFDIEHDVSSELIIEWRALTVALLDKTAERVWDRLGISQQQMTLAQILEGGTWAAGRELAFAKRPSTGDPPIRINSTGDTF